MKCAAHQFSFLYDDNNDGWKSRNSTQVWVGRNLNAPCDDATAAGKVEKWYSASYNHWVVSASDLLLLRGDIRR